MLTSSVFLEEINSFRGWWFKDQRWHMNSQADSFSMTFLIAASENNFYGIMANENTNNSKIFGYFISNVWNYRTRNLNRSNGDLWFVADNASIHKTKEIRNLIDCNELHMLTIPPYWPSLNPVETVIQSIKAKLKVKQAKGK